MTALLRNPLSAVQSGVNFVYRNLFSAAKSSVPRHRAVVLGLDGVHCPTLDKLMKQGSVPTLTALSQLGMFTMSAECCYPSISEPNWASFLYGANPATMGFYDILEEYPTYQHFENKGGVKNIYSYIKQAYPDARTAALYGWELMPDILNPAHVDVNLAADVKLTHAQRDAWLVEEAVKLFRSDNAPHFTFIHIDNIDETGHEVGVEGIEYINSIIHVDSQVKQIYDSLPPDTTLFIVSDHGRAQRTGGRDHNEFSPDAMNIPLWVVGAGAPAAKTPTHASIIDLAPTILSLFKTPQPWTMRGRPIEHFQPPV